MKNDGGVAVAADDDKDTNDDDAPLIMDFFSRHRMCPEGKVQKEGRQV